MINTPVELLKCRAQVNRQGSIRYKDVVRELGVAGLFKGAGPLFWRDVPAWGVYFWAYELLKKTNCINSIEERGQKLSGKQVALKMLCGGVAGQLSWIVSYPFDIIKTIVQTSDKRLSIVEVAREGYLQEGHTFFWKGIWPTLGRSFVCNCVTLPAFDYCN